MKMTVILVMLAVLVVRTHDVPPVRSRAARGHGAPTVALGTAGEVKCQPLSKLWCASCWE